MKSLQRKWELAGAILLLFFVLMGVVYSAILSTDIRYTDEQDYLTLSDHLVHGPGFSMDGVHLTATRAPGYAYFLAAIRAVGGGFITFRIVQVILLAVTVHLVARQLLGERKNSAALLIVTGLAICYPVLLYTSATLYPQTVAGSLFVLALAFLLKSPESHLLNLAGGVTFGALILTVPTFLFTLFVTLGAARYFRIVRTSNAALVLLAAGMMVGVWTARNAVCFDRFVPIATNSGLNLLEGNNEHATALAAANVGMAPYYREVEKQGLDEFQADRFYRDAAIAWIEAHPVDAAVLYVEKVANFFNIINVYSSETQAEVSPWRQVILAAGYLLLLGLVGWRLIDARSIPLTPREKLFLAVYVLSAFTSALFFTRIRHRLPYDFLLIAVAAGHLCRRIEAAVAGVVTKP